MNTVGSRPIQLPGLISHNSHPHCIITNLFTNHTFTVHCIQVSLIEKNLLSSTNTQVARDCTVRCCIISSDQPCVGIIFLREQVSCFVVISKNPWFSATLIIYLGFYSLQLTDFWFKTQYGNFVQKSFKSYEVDCSWTFTSVQGHYFNPPHQLNLWWGSKAPFKSNILYPKTHFKENLCCLRGVWRYQPSGKIMLAWYCGLFCLEAVVLWSNRWYLCQPTLEPPTYPPPHPP